jgi:hypothetical protein
MPRAVATELHPKSHPRLVFKMVFVEYLKKKKPQLSLRFFKMTSLFFLGGACL